MFRLRFAVLFLATAWFAAAALVAGAAETGATVTATDLRERPFLDAPVLARLAPDTRLEILQRQSGWMRVKIGRREGWVRLLATRLDPQPAASVGASWMARLGLQGGRARGIDPASPTITTGIRGLSAVELENAQPDPQQLKQLQGFRASAEQARAYAEAGGLSSFSVPAFDEKGKPLKDKP